jgi:class 3 adenylate cyclase/tetratricopeptide (TPR) repeat protein
MHCSKCQFDNLDDSVFCGNCGAPLSANCPSCGSVTPSGYKFCTKCGNDLRKISEEPIKELSFDQKIEKIQKYLPKGLTEKILSQKDRIEGERKQVTVMFCDMAGFTALVEKLGPEESYNIMDKVYEILIHKVHSYEGTVNEMTGDGILALFGAPIALEDGPQRAIRSAMAIHREMAEFNDKLRSEKETTPLLKMRIGIHTGYVIVGTLGNDLRVEFKVVGDTVNLASRMEELADPGSTYISEKTFRITEGFFRFEALGEKQIKGKKYPVPTYRVIAPSTRRTRFDVNAERGLTPFVGRNRELEYLLDGFKRSKNSQGQVFSILSEAGVGKSRLLYEFRKAVSNENVVFLEGKCLSYSRAVPYHPIIDLVKSNFDINDDDDDSIIKDKILTGLKVLSAEEKSTFPYLLELLGVKESGITAFSLSPEAKKDRIFEAINHVVIKASHIRPLIMAIEDLHWIDKSSEDFLKAFFNTISAERILLIFTYRPEYIHTWGTKSNFNYLNLNRLYNSESLSMTTHILGTEKIGIELEKLVLEKAEGVPFFVEEFIQSLKDLRIIERKDNVSNLTKDIKEVIIPSSIHDIIMARVDSLPEKAKELLQICSAIEREFEFKLIKQVTRDSEQDLLSNISVLKESELLYERGIRPNSNFIFRHSLIREVVYDSILAKKKKNLHEKIGEAIELLYEGHIDNYYEILAEHFYLSNCYEKALGYSVLSCKKAEKKASFIDSINSAKRGIEILKNLPDTEKMQRCLIDIKTKLGIYFSQMYDTPSAMKSVESVIDLASRLNYKKRLSQIYTIFGHYYSMVEEEYTKSFEYYEDAIRISEEAEDIMSYVFAIYGYGGSLSLYVCDFEKGQRMITKAIDFNKAAKNLWGISAIKGSLSYFNFYTRGKIDLSYNTSKEAMLIADKSGDISSKAIAQVCLGVSLYGLGNLKDAEEHLLQAVEFCIKLNLLLWLFTAYTHLAEIEYDLDRFQESIAYSQKAITLIGADNLFPSYKNQCKVAIARAKIRKNKDIDLNSVYNCAEQIKAKSIEGLLSRYIGEILLHFDDNYISDAENWIKKAIKQDSQNGTMYQLGRDYVIYTELFKLKRNQPKAIEYLKLAIEIFDKCGASGWVTKYERELAEL